MAVNRLWYPDRMLTRSRASPPSFQYKPSSVGACMQWRDGSADRTVVRKTTTETRTTTESMEQSDVPTHNQQQQQPMQLREVERCNVGNQYDSRRAPYESRHAVNRYADGGHCGFRCRSPCRHVGRATVTSSRPCRHLPNDSDIKCRHCHLANPVEQTTWTSLGGRGGQLEDDEVIEAVHKVASGDPPSWTSSKTVGERFVDKQPYRAGMPPRPSRSALRSTTRSPERRRWVEVREDDRGRPVDLTVFRPVTPQITASILPHRTVAEASSRRLIEVRGDEAEQDRSPADLPVAVEPVTPQIESTIPTSTFNDSRRWVEVREDEEGRAVDLTVVRPSSPQTSALRRNSLRAQQRVEFAPEPGYQTTYHPSNRPTSAWSRAHSDLGRRARHEQVTERELEAADDDAARQALMAIYQAGKSDMMFHSRAPSSATLERMLRAVSDGNVRDRATATSALGKFDSSQVVAGRVGRRYPGRDVSDDDKPVKVKVECPASSDTFVSFRVQSRAA